MMYVGKDLEKELKKQMIKIEFHSRANDPEETYAVLLIPNICSFGEFTSEDSIWLFLHGYKMCKTVLKRSLLYPEFPLSHCNQLILKGFMSEDSIFNGNSN